MKNLYRQLLGQSHSDLQDKHRTYTPLSLLGSCIYLKWLGYVLLELEPLDGAGKDYFCYSWGVLFLQEQNLNQFALKNLRD